MIETQHLYDGEEVIALYCDSCPATEESDGENFMEFIGRMLRAGWRMSKVSNEWWHECPECNSPEKDFPDA